MPEIIIPLLLITAAVSELVYIVFREIRFTTVTIPLFVAAIIIAAYNIIVGFGLSSFISLSSLLLLIASKIKLRSRPYEKPDYRYLIILISVIIFHIK